MGANPLFRGTLTPMSAPSRSFGWRTFHTRSRIGEQCKGQAAKRPRSPKTFRKPLNNWKWLCTQGAHNMALHMVPGGENIRLPLDRALP